ncbi:carboxypeptidase regulatory-like domain-containing protein [Sporosarcina thermotolerans]|uniref:carboxypeptidase regulatory-like domain-containing protein n=1 Tax=Sporosarcina thermotolerans TaxID=633404 RepID=UPI0024BC47FC|nr:carboxypeptidase regulatory-like domain-containing protein [Sporosarcina thermotolerans]WHT48290.1 carboxypeptidase regulatory-like domain-containing protein [Sporosarcina thermotolerans]
MKTRDFRKALNSLLAFVLVLSMMMPFSASASAKQVKPFKPNTQSESTMQMIEGSINGTMVTGQVDGEITYSVNYESLRLELGEGRQLTVTETTTKPDGTTVEKDVTADATFASADNTVAIVYEGFVTSVYAGKTYITVDYGDFTTLVNIEVTSPSHVNMHEINIDANSDERIINSGRGILLSKVRDGQYGRSIDMSWSISSEGIHKLSFPADSIQPNDEYKVIYWIEYEEDGETNTYYNEMVVKGDELLEVTGKTIPSDEDLLKTALSSENSGLGIYEMRFIPVDREQWSDNYNILYVSNGLLVSENPIILQYVIEGEKDETKHFLNGKVTIGKPIDYDTLLADSSKVEFDGTYNWGYLNLKNSDITFLINEGENAAIQLSNGTYNLSFSNNANWDGVFVIDSDQTIQIPTAPTKLEFTSLNTNTNHFLWVNYELTLGSGQFRMSGIPVNPIEFELFNGSEKVFEWSDEYFHSSIEIDASTWKSGTYTVKATYLTEEGNELSAEESFVFDSGVQELKGTVFTAENSKGELLQSGIVTLYEKTGEKENRYYNRVISKEIKSVNGVYEAFIPDAYILDGLSYYMTVVDHTSKTMYAKEFTGQADKNYHFSATDLVEMKVDTGFFNTDSVNFMLLGMDNSTSVSVNLFEFGWHVSKDAKFLVNWVGTNANNEKYKWFGFVNGDNEFSLDLTNVDWQLLKPSSKYENASLSLYPYGETYSKLYVSEKIIGNPSTYLTVRDGDTTYKGPVPYGKDKKEQGIEFTTYDGYAYTNSNSTIVFTYFENDYGQLDIIGENSFTYEIYDENDKRIGEPILTHYFDSFALTEPLKKGIYKIKLVESTVNKEIVSLSMDSFIYVDGQEKPLAIPVELDTKYGKFQPRQMTIQNDDLDSHEYGRTFNLNLNFYDMQFTMPYGLELNPDSQYKILLTGTLQNNLGVIDIQAMKGEQLLNSSKSNPLQLSEDLKSIKITHNLNPTTIQRAELNFGLATDGYSPFSPIRVSGKESFQVLASPNNYHGRIIVVDNSQNATVLNVPKTTIADNMGIEVDGKDLAKVTIKDMKISGYEYYPNRFSLHSESDWVSSMSQQKGQYSPLRYYIASNEENDTPWSYSVVKFVDLNEDKEFIFDKKAISGNIFNFQLDKIGNKNYYLQAFVSLHSGDFQITNIYRALENNPQMMSAEASEDPIRDYIGEFSGEYDVPVEYTVKDHTGKTVWQMTGSINDREFAINKELIAGTYTFEVHIPTALRQSITLKEEFTVTGENTPFVQIHTPQSGLITNAESITVIGKANADVEVTLELQKDGKKVSGTVVAADSEGAYTHTFHPETDGEYTIVASNEDATTSVVVTIDRTPPEKASNIQITKEAGKLIVTWTGAEDAVSYKVEVAENDGEFTVLSESQKGTTAVISNIKPGTTYKVKITSSDAAKNTSVSDVASFTVDAFTATEITLKDGRNADKLLSIGDELAVTVDGSYEEGFTAVANVYVDGKAHEVVLSYNETSKLYEGIFIVKEGQKVIEKVTGQILNGEEKTEEISNELNWSVGSTVKGLVKDGQPVEDATVRLVSNKTYTVKTDANGAFEVKGLPSGKYKISVLVNGNTYAQQDLEVGQSKIVAAPDYKVPAFTDASITIFDKVTDKPVTDVLSARLTGPKGYIVFGSTVNGKFTTNNGQSVLKDLETGEYKLTVYGQGTYLTTTASINLVKGTTDYKFEVDKLTIDEKTLTIKFNADVEKIDSIYLYSYSTYQKHGYTGVGNYYKYNVKPENGAIVFENVAAADDYWLDIYAEGFMSYHQNVVVADNPEIKINLEQGRVITGKVTDSQGQPVANAYVYAYGGYTNAYAETDATGEYKLSGLSKTDDIWIDVYSQLYLSHQETIVVGDDEVEKNIQLAKAVMMTGKVVDPNGDPLANVSISADGQTTYGWGRTATDGSFAVTGLKTLRPTIYHSILTVIRL